MTPVMKMQLKNTAMRVLHAPGGPLAGGAVRTGNSIQQGQTGGFLQPAAGHSNSAPLEMSLIFDGALSKEDVKAAGADIISTLKSTDEIFRNVRCNVVFWLSDEKITHEPTAAAVVQMGRCFENWEQVTGQTADSKVGQADKAAPKRMEILTADLKKFEARSRLLILVTDGNYVTEDKDALQQNLNPFLKYRLLIVTPEKIWQGKYL